MNCYSLTVGSRNGVKAAATISKRDDQTLRKITARYFPNGSTILNADGSWYDPVAKKYVSEQSRQILVCANSIHDLKPWYNDLIFAMQQKALMVVELGPVNFIIADPQKLIPMQTFTKGPPGRKPPKTTIVP